MEISGFPAYLVFFLTFVGIYGVLILGLNLQWGFTGQVNFGVAAFFMVGAYTMALTTTAPIDGRFGGFGLPLIVGLIISMVASGVLALLVGLVTLRLRADYLAIATIGIAEIVRQFLKNEDWLTSGVRGISLDKPFEGEVGGAEPLIYLAIVLAAVVIVFVALERLRKSPFGRVLRALRENEDTARASGKSVVSFQLQVFVLGSSIMGLAGALYASFYAFFISPEAFTNTVANFLPWVMLIAGGSGNNYGTLLGAFVIWVVWSLSDYLIGQVIPASMVTQAGAIRLLLIGVLLQVILLFRPRGLLPEGFRISFTRKE